MSVSIKTEHEIELMREAGHLLEKGETLMERAGTTP